MKFKLLILITILFGSAFPIIFSTIAQKNDVDDSEQVTRILTENSQFIDWSKDSTPYEVFDNIFVGEIVSIVGTYIKNEEDYLSNRDIPITHYKVEIHHAIKGDYTEIVDVYFYGGYDDGGLVLYDFSLELPKVGESMIFFCSQPSETMISVDSRLFEGVYQNWGRPGTLIKLEYFNPSIPLSSQTIIAKQKIEQVIDNFEKFTNSQIE